MLQVIRTSPVLIIQLALITASVLVLAFTGALVSRSGSSIRPIYWMLGLILLIIGPQFLASLYLSLGAVNSAAPRVAALEQLATSTDTESRQAAARVLFGRDADAQLVRDARTLVGDAMASAELAQFAVVPNGDSVLLGQFKSSLAAEKAWIAYLRETGLGQLGGKGDSQRGYAVTRPIGDRAYVLHFGSMVGVWTAKDDSAIRQRMAAGGFPIPSRAPLTGVSPRTSGSPVAQSIPAALGAPLLVLNVFLVVLYFFKGAAWAGTYQARAGTTPVAVHELASRLEKINSLDVPFQIESGPQPHELIATWRYADAKWIDLARARGVKRSFRVRITLDEKNGTVRATDYEAGLDWSVGRSGADLQWRASLGIVFFQYEHQRVFGLQMDEDGSFKPQLSYTYTFNLKEMKAPLIEAVTRSGWIWRPTVWQGPSWLRWLTE